MTNACGGAKCLQTGAGSAAWLRNTLTDWTSGLLDFGVVLLLAASLQELLVLRRVHVVDHF
jgi:hypothetical protein